MTQQMQTNVVPLRWVGDRATGHVEMIDQRLLPHDNVWHTYTTAEEIAASIKDMVIRGAPAIGIAAAYGVCLGVRQWAPKMCVTPSAHMTPLLEMLANTRPTAVNLFWALEKMKQAMLAHENQRPEDAKTILLGRLFDLAEQIFEEDRQNNLTMGFAGAELMPEGARILTHCNTGGLATGGYGTALGVIRATHATGKLAHVWVDETRPYLQGARLTAWECVEDEIPATLITDNMAAFFMAQGKVDAVIVGADRIAANGDTANKIGTYGLAVLCQYHKIPFYVAIPISSLDRSLSDGSQIPIEQRSAEEVTHVRGQSIAPDRIEVAHPAFDVTPASLITAIITERGVLRPPFVSSIAALEM